MAKIDASGWGEFRVGDMFEIHPTVAYKMINDELFDDDGINPVIANSVYNNGIVAYSNREVTEKAGTITFLTTSATPFNNSPIFCNSPNRSSYTNCFLFLFILLVDSFSI